MSSSKSLNTPSHPTLQSLHDRLTALEARHSELSVRNAELESLKPLPSSVLKIHVRATEERFEERDRKLERIERDLEQAPSKADYTTLASRVLELKYRSTDLKKLLETQNDEIGHRYNELESRLAELETRNEKIGDEYNHLELRFLELDQRSITLCDMLEAQGHTLEAKCNDLKASYTTLNDSLATLKMHVARIENFTNLLKELLEAQRAVLEAKNTVLEILVAKLEIRPSTSVAEGRIQEHKAQEDMIYRKERVCPNCRMTGHRLDACKWNCTICKQEETHMGMNCPLLGPGRWEKDDDKL